MSQTLCLLLLLFCANDHRRMSDMILNLHTIEHHLICSQSAKLTWKHYTPFPSFP